jgi:outer membrane biosynthesis protein TonB
LKRLADQTLYEILDVPADAAPAAIAAAYERARALYGPGSLATYTLMSPEEAAVLTSRIEEAKSTLLDADARARYDASLAKPEPGPRPGSNGVNGASHTPFAAMPPVIPALQPPAPPPAPESAPDPAPEPGPEPGPEPVARPADLLRAAAEAATPEPQPGPAPIRLDREIAVPASPEPPPTATPPPAPSSSASTSASSPAPPTEPAPEVPIPDGALWTGEALRRVREARGITVQQISERTKVTRHHLENIEGERFSALPAPVYLRGILLTIARELRLDGQKVARAYLERVAGAAGQGAGRAR